MPQQVFEFVYFLCSMKFKCIQLSFVANLGRIMSDCCSFNTEDKIIIIYTTHHSDTLTVSLIPNIFIHQSSLNFNVST